MVAGMTVRVYSSADVGAPVLNMSSGSLVAVLDACLVNGYGSKPGSGWAKSFADSTLRAAYKQGVGGNGHYFYLDDSAGASARCRGYEAMTDINTGTRPFPFDAPLYMHKHNGVAGDRGWYLIANESTFYFVTQYDTATYWTSSSLTAFGKTRSYHPGDNWDTMLIAAINAVHTGDASGGSALGSFGTNAGFYTPRYDMTFYGHFMARRWHGMGSASNVAKYGVPMLCDSDLCYKMSNVGAARIGMQSYGYIPNPPDGAIFLNPLRIIEDRSLRATIPGLWQHYLGQRYMTTGDRMFGTGELAGREFMYFCGWHTSYFIEVSDTW